MVMDYYPQYPTYYKEDAQNTIRISSNFSLKANSNSQCKFLMNSISIQQVHAIMIRCNIGIPRLNEGWNYNFQESITAHSRNRHMAPNSRSRLLKNRNNIPEVSELSTLTYILATDNFEVRWYHYDWQFCLIIHKW